ncbi:2'-5' RNA ligase family protein [Nonomuraea sp. NPDC004702]
MTTEETETRNHWWWRPGWRQGRSCYTWHILVDDQPGIHAFAQRIQPELESTGVLGPIPLEWLHMTMQGVGFTHETSEQAASEIATAVTDRLASLAPVEVIFGPAVADPEGVNLPVRPAETMEKVRRAVRAGIADVWGPDRVPEAEGGFRPHVSLAYSHTTGASLAPIRKVLARHPTTISVVIKSASLININRDRGVYQWRVIHQAPLGVGSR